MSDSLYWELLKDYHKVFNALKRAIKLIETIEGIGYRYPEMDRKTEKALKRFNKLVKLLT